MINYNIYVSSCFSASNILYNVNLLQQLYFIHIKKNYSYVMEDSSKCKLTIFRLQAITINEL